MNRGDETIIGIDLGTTFSLVACADEGGARVLRDAGGEARLPSVIGFTKPDDGGEPRMTIGWEARRHAVENPLATVYSIKRLIGKSIDEVRSEASHLAYAVRQGPRDTVQVDVHGRPFTPEALSAAILRELRDRAETQLRRPVRRAVVTVPAYFDDAQRQATRDAGSAAGLEVVRIINEPTAAALAYGIGLRKGRASDARRRRPGEGVVPLPQPQCHDSAGPGDGSGAMSPARHPDLVAVYDLGGGTFDISILRIEDGVFQVLATAGDTHLGGDDFDRRIIELVQRETQQVFGLSIDTPATRQALRLLAEAVKIRLSEADSADIELDVGAGRVFRRTIRREEFESLTADLIERTIELSRRAVRDARLEPDAIGEIVLVGGSTRMPAVRRRVAEEFGRPPYTALNPDEVVALGAAIQGAIIAGTEPEMLLLDVTPLSLGIETMGGAVGKLILRNAAIPCRATEMFTTFVDGQTAIKIRVLQGERELAKDCRSLGEFELRGIPPMPAGIPKVEVEFLIDANGILNVSARELRSGQQAGIQVVPNRGLTREEVERIKRESARFGRQDLDEHRRIDLVNQVEFDTHKAEQALARVGDQLDEEERERLLAEIAALRALAAEPRDLDALHRALDAFGRSTVRLAELGIREALQSS